MGFVVRCVACVVPAAAPILMFYALSQAGRALCAARITGQRWNPAGHGLKIRGAGGPLGDTIIEPDGDEYSSFALLCRAIKAERLRAATTLGALWAANTRTESVTGLGADCAPAVEVSGIGKDRLKGNIVGALADGLPSNVDDALSVLRDRLIGRYPATTDGLVVEAVNVDHDGRPQVEVSWRTDADERRCITEIAPGLTRLPRNGAYLLPALNSAGDKLPFLALWWATLLALSSVARYSPDRWVAALARDHSLHAMPIEGALQNAHELLPHMLLAEFSREPSEAQ